MSRLEFNSDDARQKRAPFCVWLPLLTAPFGVISALALSPPSASGQYVFFVASVLRVVLFPLAAIAIVLACIALLRRGTYLFYRLIVVGFLAVIIGAVLALSGYHYGPGP